MEFLGTLVACLAKIGNVHTYHLLGVTRCLNLRPKRLGERLIRSIVALSASVAFFVSNPPALAGAAAQEQVFNPKRLESRPSSLSTKLKKPAPVATVPRASNSPGKRFDNIWKPALATSWHWMLDHALDINDPKDMGLVDPNGKALKVAPPTTYDIDWEMNSAKTVRQLHAMNKSVICYVDVGAYETYRADAKKFPKAVRGNPDSHWEGSYWLDIRRLEVLIPIMRARFQVCKDKGFDAIEPDEVDGYANDSGFKLSYNDQLTYNRAIADLAHSMGMSVGLKGDIEQVRDLWKHFDWTLNEQCYEFEECDALTKYFIANGKAVFHVEYDDPFSGHQVKTSEFCPQANAANFNSMKMPLDLSGGRWPCR